MRKGSNTAARSAIAASFSARSPDSHEAFRHFPFPDFRCRRPLCGGWLLVSRPHRDRNPYVRGVSSEAQLVGFLHGGLKAQQIV